MSDEWKENRRLAMLDEKKAEIDRRFSIGIHDGQSCENCYYWDGKKYGDGNWSASRCVRHAPSYTQTYWLAESPLAQDPSIKAFPYTLYDDWCGDWAKKA